MDEIQEIEDRYKQLLADNLAKPDMTPERELLTRLVVAQMEEQELLDLASKKRWNKTGVTFDD